MDASKYTGVNFTFSTISQPNLLLNVAFAIQTTATTPVENGGTCTSACFDGFGFSGTVPPGQFSFSGGFTWDQLVQQGFGTPATFDPATIMSIQWVVSYLDFGQPASADDFDFTLGDVLFQKSLVPSSSGAGGGMGAGGSDGAGGSTGAGGSMGMSGGGVDGGRPPSSDGAIPGQRARSWAAR